MDDKAILDGIVASERAKWRYTPGPWRLHPTDDTMVVDRKGWDVAEMCGDYDLESTTMEANARLIAAAPDMLAALRELVKNAVFGEPVPDWLNAWDDARAAIAKATESPGASNLKG